LGLFIFFLSPTYQVLLITFYLNKAASYNPTYGPSFFFSKLIPNNFFNFEALLGPNLLGF